MSEIGSIKMNIVSPNMVKWRTCFSSISYNGYKLDILKSGVQKYLRRREFEKMVWCVAEIYLFQALKTTEQQERATKGIITNLINRLIIMLDEEMLFAEVNKYLLVRKYMEIFEERKRADFTPLYKICKILCGARMLRRNSDIRVYFKHAMMNKASGILPPPPLVSTTVYAVPDYYYFDNFKTYFKLEDKQQAVNCYYWLFKIFMGGHSGSVKRFKRKENIYMIWEFLFNRKNIQEDPSLKKCLEYRLKEFHNKSKRERFIFLTAAVDIALFMEGKSGNFFNMNIETEINKEMKEYDKNFGESTEIINRVYKDRVYLDIDDYVIDMHCSLGRKLGKTKKDFAISGAVVINEDKEFYVDAWRKRYNSAKLKPVVKKKKSEKIDKSSIKAVIVEGGGKKKERSEREKIRAAKYKRIKKLRGIPNFNDLEKNLDFMNGIDEKKIMLCVENTCGNKVMCFRYEGQIWKEGRKSMNYNRDYCVLDECKKLFGLEKIGMKRVLSNFRIEKIDKSKKSWLDNWRKAEIKEGEEPVVYCVMNKIVPGIEIGKKKKELLKNRKLLKEFVKIGVFRGIFRVSDFNGRNVLLKGEDELVSIDEGDIGKRLDIIGGREKWLVAALNKDKTIINEILAELAYLPHIISCLEMMERYKFGLALINEVENNWKNLRKDLEAEGVLFD